MDGLQYEQFCAEWLRKQGYRKIQVTRSSGDQGIDILAAKHGYRYGFQCKYYENPVGNDAVQQAFAGAAFYTCDKAAVITNTTFTRSAYELAEETGVELYEGISPEGRSLHARYLKTTGFLILLGGLATITYLSQYENSHGDTAVWASVFMILSGLTRFFAKGNIQISLLDCLFESVWAALSLLVLKEASGLLYVWIRAGIFGLCVTAWCRWSVMQKKHVRRNSEILRQELSKQIEESTRELGESMKAILQDDLHTSLLLSESVRNPDGSSSYTYSATRIVDADLALSEYTLNQYADHDQNGMRYQLESISPKVFRLTIRKNKNQQ